MQSSIQVFHNQEIGDVRIIQEEDDILFCGRDIAALLGFTNVNDACTRHCKKIFKRNIKDSFNRVQEVNFILQEDVYRLISQSKLPESIVSKFKNWIFSDVLPSIRKRDEYNDSDIICKLIETPEAVIVDEIINSSDLALQLLTVFKEQYEKNRQLKQENQMMKAKARYFDNFVENNLFRNLQDTAKEFGITEKEFLDFLVVNNYIYYVTDDKFLPYQQYIDEDLFVIKEQPNSTNKFSTVQLMVTPKGRETFRLLLKAMSASSTLFF